MLGLHIFVYNDVLFIDRNCLGRNRYHSFPFCYFQLDFKLNSESGGDTSTFIANGEWDLVGNHSFREIESLLRQNQDCVINVQTLFVISFAWTSSGVGHLNALFCYCLKESHKIH